MSKIQQKLDSLQPFINGIRYIQGMQIVDAMFKEGWTVPNSDIIRKELVDKDQNYYMFFSENEGVTFDDLLDYVEGIIKINIERENKNILFKEKVKELQGIFKESSLSKLKTLSFNFSDDVISSSIMDMGIDDEIDTGINEEPIMEPVIEEKVDVAEVKVKSNLEVEANPVMMESRTVNANGQNIELPPKKVVLEDYSLPPESTMGGCSCGENEACGKCLDYK